MGSHALGFCYIPIDMHKEYSHVYSYNKTQSPVILVTFLVLSFLTVHSSRSRNLRTGGGGGGGPGGILGKRKIGVVILLNLSRGGKFFEI